MKDSFKESIIKFGAEVRLLSLEIIMTLIVFFTSLTAFVFNARMVFLEKEGKL